MDKKEFEAEMLRRMNALRMQFTYTETSIKVRLKGEKWTIMVLDPVEGDNRKCVVRCYYTNFKKRRNGVYPTAKLMFEKPCTTYYLLQYITGYSNRA